MSFETWMENVDQQLVKIVGMVSSGLEDYNWHDLFDLEYSPKDAAEIFVEELEGWF